MPSPRFAKKIVIIFALLLAFAGISALLALRFIEHRIALNAHAPHLVRIAEPAADFPFRTLDGKLERLSAAKGKVVFLDLWGTWCIQCVAEMPTIQALYNHYRSDPDVTFLIVSRLDSPAAVRNYARRNHLDLPFYTTDDADIPPSMQLNQYPATFLYEPDGAMAAMHTGAADWSAPAVITFIDSLKRAPQ